MINFHDIPDPGDGGDTAVSIAAASAGEPNAETFSLIAEFELKRLVVLGEQRREGLKLCASIEQANIRLSHDLKTEFFRLQMELVSPFIGQAIAFMNTTRTARAKAETEENGSPADAPPKVRRTKAPAADA